MFDFGQPKKQGPVYRGLSEVVTPPTDQQMVNNPYAVTPLNKVEGVGRFLNSPQFAKLGYNPSADMDDIYYKNTPWYSQAKNASVQFLGTFGSSFEANLNKAEQIRNTFGTTEGDQLLDMYKASEALREKYPLFKSKDEISGIAGYVPFVGDSFSKWSNFAPNLGFTFGTMAEVFLENLVATVAIEAATGGFGTPAALAKWADGFYKIGKAITFSNNLSKVNRARNLGVAVTESTKLFGSVGNLFRGVEAFKDGRKLAGALHSAYGGYQLYSNAAGEAVVENAHSMGEMMHDLVLDFKEKNGREPSPEELKNIQNASEGLILPSTLGNIGILMLSNSLQEMNAFKAGKALSGTVIKGASGRVAGEVGKKFTLDKSTGLWRAFSSSELNKNTLKAIGSSALNVFSEGAEEFSQGVVAEASKSYHKAKFYDKPISSLTAVKKGFEKASSPEGMEEFWAGIVTGAMFGGGGKIANAYQLNKDKDKLAQRGQSIESLTEEAVKDLNSTTSILKFNLANSNSAKNFKEQLIIEEKITDALKRGDTYAASVYKKQGLIRTFMTAAKYGKTGMLKEHYKGLSELERTDLSKYLGIAETDLASPEEITETLELFEKLSKYTEVVNKKYANPFRKARITDPKYAAIEDVLEREKTYLEDTARYDAWESTQELLIGQQVLGEESRALYEEVEEKFEAANINMHQIAAIVSNSGKGFLKSGLNKTFKKGGDAYLKELAMKGKQLLEMHEMAKEVDPKYASSKEAKETLKELEDIESEFNIIQDKTLLPEQKLLKLANLKKEKGDYLLNLDNISSLDEVMQLYELVNEVQRDMDFTDDLLTDLKNPRRFAKYNADYFAHLKDTYSALFKNLEKVEVIPPAQTVKEDIVTSYSVDDIEEANEGDDNDGEAAKEEVKKEEVIVPEKKTVFNKGDEVIHEGKPFTIVAVTFDPEGGTEIVYNIKGEDNKIKKFVHREDLSTPTGEETTGTINKSKITSTLITEEENPNLPGLARINVKTENGELIGTVGIYTKTGVFEKNGKKYASISGISTTENFRGKGLGIELYKQAFKHLKQLGFDGLYSTDDEVVEKKKIGALRSKLIVENLGNGEYLYLGVKEESVETTTEKEEPAKEEAAPTDIEAKKADKEARGQKAVQRRLQDLRESTSEKQIAQAIINVEKNVKAGAPITKEEQDFVNSKKQELKDKGFEIIDYTNKVWNIGLNLEILRFKTLEEDENLTQKEIDILEKELENRKRKRGKLKEKGLSEKEIDNQLEDTISIMTTVQPGLTKDGKMVQAAKVDALQIEVSQVEKILERSKKNPKGINAKYDAELAALESPQQSNEEAKKADIERRRPTSYIRDSKDKKSPLETFRNEAKREWDGVSVITGDRMKNLYVGIQLFVEAYPEHKDLLDKFIKKENGTIGITNNNLSFVLNTLKKQGVTTESELGVKINTKYDAELAALEGEQKKEDITPEGFKNKVFDSNVQLGEYEEKYHLSEIGYNYRVLSQKEIDAIVESGAVFPREGKQKGGNKNIKYWTKGNGKNWFGDKEDLETIRVKEENFKTDKVVLAENVEVYNKETGKFEPLLKPTVETSPVEESGIKEGVAELFESNPELANSAYKAMGIYNVWHSSNEKIDKFISENVEGYFAKVKKGSPKAIFFTANKPPQESFLSKREYQQQFGVKMNNPLIVDTKTGYSRDTESFKELVDRALANNHDGVVVKNVDDNGFIGDVYISLNAEQVSQITPQQKQQAQQLYSQYLDTIFPDSKVKEIKQHSTEADFESFTKEGSGRLGKGFYFSDFGNNYIEGENVKKKLVLLNIKNPLNIQGGQFMKDVYKLLDDRNQSSDDTDAKIQAQKDINNQYKQKADALIGDKNGVLNSEIKVFEPEQIHILGSQQDIEGFKKFTTKELTKEERVLSMLEKVDPLWRNVIIENPLAALKMIADQALQETGNTAGTTIKTFGEDLVWYAITGTLKQPTEEVTTESEDEVPTLGTVDDLVQQDEISQPIQDQDDLSSTVDLTLNFKEEDEEEEEETTTENIDEEEKLVEERKEKIKAILNEREELQALLQEALSQQNKAIEKALKKEISKEEEEALKKELGVKTKKAVHDAVKEEVDNVLQNRKSSRKLSATFKTIIQKILTTLLTFALIINLNVNASFRTLSTPPVATPAQIELSMENENLLDNFSADARAIYQSNVGKKESYIIVDKPTATAYIFSSNNKLVKSFPILLGAATGEAKNIADAYSDKPGKFSTTPAGDYKLSISKSKSGQQLYKNKILMFDAGQSLAIHITYPGELEKRTQSLNTPTAEDNRMSWGCINVSEENWDKYISKTVKPGDKIFITRDNQKSEKSTSKKGLLDITVALGLLLRLRKKKEEGTSFTQDDIKEIQGRLLEIEKELEDLQYKDVSDVERFMQAVEKLLPTNHFNFISDKSKIYRLLHIIKYSIVPEWSRFKSKGVSKVLKENFNELSAKYKGVTYSNPANIKEVYTHLILNNKVAGAYSNFELFPFQNSIFLDFNDNNSTNLVNSLLEFMEGVEGYMMVASAQNLARPDNVRIYKKDGFLTPQEIKKLQTIILKNSKKSEELPFDAETGVTMDKLPSTKELREFINSISDKELKTSAMNYLRIFGEDQMFLDDPKMNYKNGLSLASFNGLKLFVSAYNQFKEKGELDDAAFIGAIIDNQLKRMSYYGEALALLDHINQTEEFKNFPSSVLDMVKNKAKELSAFKFAGLPLYIGQTIYAIRDGAEVTVQNHTIFDTGKRLFNTLVLNSAEGTRTVTPFEFHSNYSLSPVSERTKEEGKTDAEFVNEVNEEESKALRATTLLSTISNDLDVIEVASKNKIVGRLVMQKLFDGKEEGQSFDYMMKMETLEFNNPNSPFYIDKESEGSNPNVPEDIEGMYKDGELPEKEFGKIITLVNAYGEHIKFNDEGEEDANGIIPMFFMPSPMGGPVVIDERQISYGGRILQPMDDLVENLGKSKEVILAEKQAEADLLDKIRSVTEPVYFKLQDISKGIITLDTMVKYEDIEGLSPRVRLIERGENKGHVLLDTKGNSPILLKRAPMGKDLAIGILATAGLDASYLRSRGYLLGESIKTMLKELNESVASEKPNSVERTKTIYAYLRKFNNFFYNKKDDYRMKKKDGEKTNEIMFDKNGEPIIDKPGNIEFVSDIFFDSPSIYNGLLVHKFFKMKDGGTMRTTETGTDLLIFSREWVEINSGASESDYFNHLDSIVDFLSKVSYSVGKEFLVSSDPSTFVVETTEEGNVIEYKPLSSLPGYKKTNIGDGTAFESNIAKFVVEHSRIDGVLLNGKIMNGLNRYMTFSLRGDVSGTMSSKTDTLPTMEDSEENFTTTGIYNILPLIDDAIEDNVTDDVREAAMTALRTLQKESRKLKKVDPTVKLISVEDYNKTADLIEKSNSVSEINKALEELSKKYC